MPGLGFLTSNCKKSYEDLKARGVEFLVPPQNRVVDFADAVRPNLGVEAVFYDNSGNVHVLIEPTDPGNTELWPTR